MNVLRATKIVYVVDDEHIIASTLAKIVRSQGFDVTYFTHSHDALTAARSHVPDLLLSDVIMPDMSGIELAIEIRKLHANCSIMLLSGQAGTTDLLESARRDGHDFEILDKPVHPLTVIDGVRRLLGSPSQLPAE